MSWSLTAQGHTLTKDHEAKLIDALRALFGTEEYGAMYAMIGTQHHGQVHLKGSPHPYPGARPTA
jgi:hypothetical protein